MAETLMRERAEAQVLLACDRCGDQLTVSSLDPNKGQTVRAFTDAHHGHHPLIRIR